MSGKCKSGPSAPSPSTKQIHVMLSSNWPASYPQAFSCQGTGPRIGNDPTYNNGSNSFYQSTNLRFTEVKCRNLVSPQYVTSKLWANDSGGAGNEVVIDAPVNAGYEIMFSQYDGCSSACLQVLTNQGLKSTRLLWTKTITYGLNGPTYITLQPQYTGYSVCN